MSPARLALPALAAALALAGCTSNEGLLSGEKVDYRSAAVKSKPLDVPPDLTQLARENRYATQGGVVSAAGSPVAGAASAAAPGIVPPASDGLKVERAGDQRWLAVPMPPEQLWPIVKAFWIDRGFKLDTESPELGIMETE